MKNLNTTKGETNMKKRMKKGFTLIDMLATLAVLSILLGFGFASMKDTTDAANVTKTKADVEAGVSAAQIFFTKNGTYSGFTAPAGLGITVSDTSATDFCVEKAYGGTTYSFFLSKDQSIRNLACATARP